MEIKELENDYLLEYFELLRQLSDVGDINSFDYQSIFDDIKKNSNTCIFVCIFDKNIVGAATLLLEQKLIHCSDSSGKVGHIEDVVVDKNHRKKGIGKALIKRCIKLLTVA